MIPGMIIVGAILIVFRVCFVVFFVIADQVVQRESVMRGNEIDTGGRVATVSLVKIA